MARRRPTSPAAPGGTRFAAKCWLVFSGIIVSCIAAASLLIAVDMSKGCKPLQNVGFFNDLPLQDLGFRQILPPQPTRDSHSGRSQSGSSTWQPWELPQELLKHFPTNDSSTLDPSRFHLHIKLLTFDRIGPASRFIKSLLRADFLGDQVSLEIFLDHPFNGATGWGRRVSQRATMMRARTNMLAMLDNFTWPHGPKTVHSRALNSGIQPQWMEAWWPEDVNQFAFIAEDDTELSPFFYIYFKKLVMFYYYNQSNFDPRVYGISFQRQWLVPGFYGNRMSPPGEPFLYPLIGTWGQFVFPIQWKDYRVWYDENRYTPGRDPSIGSMITTNFWKSKGNTIWTPWQIQWAYVRGVYNVYTGFPRNLSLSVSHRTSGVNHKQTLGPDANLMMPSDLPSLKLPVGGGGWAEGTSDGGPGSVGGDSDEQGGGSELPLWWTYLPSSDRMKKYDFCFRRVPSLRVPLSSMDALMAALPDFGAEKELAVVPLPGTPAAYQQIRNWLCFLDGTNRHNYLLLLNLLPTSVQIKDSRDVSPDCISSYEEINRRTQNMANDLAARGHLVYLLPPEGSLRPSEDCSEAALAARRGSILSQQQAEFVQKLLDSGIDVLLSSIGSFWKGNPFNCIKSGGEGPNVASWLLSSQDVASGSSVQAMVSWVRASPEGVSSFKKLVETWKSEGVSELSMLSANALGTLKNELAGNVLTPTAPATSTSPASTCVSASADAPAILLAPARIGELKASKLWLVDDFFNSCRAVTCVKK